jgi:hypothetical protein
VPGSHSSVEATSVMPCIAQNGLNGATKPDTAPRAKANLAAKSTTNHGSHNAFMHALKKRREAN